jgi:DNA-directed RNA polymerase subunit K/omega
MTTLSLVEEYPKDTQLTQFEKVLVAAKRCKDLHKGTRAPLIDSERKDTYIALEELKTGSIHASYQEEEPSELPAPATEEEEEE